MKTILAKAELLKRIADAVSRAKGAGVKDAPIIFLKALKAKAKLQNCGNLLAVLADRLPER